MPISALPIANGSYQSDSLPVSAQECVNWYPNIPQAPALSPETLFGTPGTELLATTGQSKQVNRGAHVLSGVYYAVNGDALYRLNELIDADGVQTFTTTNLGTISGSGRVSMADNGTQLCILVPGGNGYIFTSGPDTLTQITDTDFTASGNPQFVVFIDGYFLFTTDSKRFIISALNNGLDYNALDFGTAESDPDDIVAPIVYKNQLFIMGSEGGEGFQNAPGATGAAIADFPFQRTGVFLDKGMFAPFSGVNASNAFMYIGGGTNESPSIWSSTGNSVAKISTTAIDSILQRFTQAQIRESFSWSYAQKGAFFVGFSLPTTTLVYETISGRWHERKSQITDSQNQTSIVRSRINSIVSAYGKVIVADSIDGRIGSLDPDVFTEYGGNIIRVIATQPFHNETKPFTVPMLELTVESGVGDSTTPDPKMRMDRSLDGKTFLDERTRSMGRVGEFKRRVIWNRNGRASRFEVFRFTMSDPVKPVIIALHANIVPGVR